MAQSTKDYKQFKYLNSNRNVDEGHKESIKRSMEKRPELFPARPILVNENYEIIDGQHRYAAATELGIPVWYEVEKGLTETDAIALNRNQKNWTLLDFINSYARQGNEQYIKLEAFIEEFSDINPSTVITFLLGNNTGGYTVAVRDGSFKVADEDEARKYLEMLQELIEALPAFRLRAVADAMNKIFKSDAYDHERMLKKVIQYGDVQLNPYGSVMDVMRSLENVYNYHQTEKGIVRLYN